MHSRCRHLHLKLTETQHRQGRAVFKGPWTRLAAVLCAAAALTAEAGTQRTQQFQLAAGWNAVYLDVDPGGLPVEEVFDTELVDAVARYFTPPTQVRFIESPDEEPWNSPGWSVWYSDKRAEAFLSNLHAVDGGTAYLVHAVKAGAMTVRGEVKPAQVKWKTDSFNLTGFATETAGITFAQYFAGAEGRLGARVYRMQNGGWQKITNLAGTPIKPGEACWVWCEGATSYNGPLELRMTGSNAVNFSQNNLVAVIELRNRINSPFSVQAAIESNDGLPLYRQAIDFTEAVAESRPFNGLTPVGTLAPGATTHLRLELRPELFTGAGRAAILKFTTSNGVVARVPVRYRAE